MQPLDDRDLERTTAGKELRAGAHHALAAWERAGVSVAAASDNVSNKVDGLGKALGVPR